MISLTWIFLLMMLPGFALLATSLIVRLFESDDSVISRKGIEQWSSKNQTCWKVEA